VVEEVGSGGGLQADQGDVMGERVVEIAGDAEPFLAGRLQGP
jgi:hypothetical protein